MTVPLIVLAVGAVFAGWLGVGMIGPEGEFWAGAIFTGEHNHVLHDMHGVPFWVKLAPMIAMVGGLGLSWYCYLGQPGLGARIAAAAGPVNRLFYNKWYFDELYERIFVRPAKALGYALWRGGDVGIIDRFGPDGVALSTLRTSKRAGQLETGYVYHYAFVMLIGVALLVSWYLYATIG
jgi:NADH-quinone oxidoreductase subunit L